jgi:two-component system cell cycle sensor histidine kinase/response regulator CckA
MPPDAPDPRPVEQALIESEARFRAFALLATEGILIHERGVVIDASQRFCELVGFATPADLIGLNGLESIGFTRESKELVLEHMRTGSNAAYDVTITRLDGTTLHAETRGGDITYRGRPMRIVHMWDIGERVRAEAERKRGEAERARLEESLAQAQKLESIGRLAGGVAHDFNNLLTVIGGNVSLALSDLGPDHPVRDYLVEGIRAVESAANLTRQLLTFSRKQVIDPRVINVNGVVSELEKMLRRLIGEDIDLQAMLDEGLGRTRVDVGQFEQILVNLAINARDAMPQGGKLTIETANVTIDEGYCRTHADAKPGRYVMLAVSDNGTGMDASVKEHVFEPFFTTKERGKGTGLGLAMVYGAVAQHGGHVEVYSEPGRGTTFKVYLPRVDDAVQSPVPAGKEIARRGSETIWLVEDADPLRTLATRLLGRQGYRVQAFRDGGEALAALATFADPIHLLLTDVVMPGMNGQTLAEQMWVVRPELKVLFTSGYTENVVVHHGVLKKGIHFLPKPYTPDVLADRVRRVLDG